MNTEVIRTSINPYKDMMTRFAGWVFSEEESEEYKGKWAQAFANPQLPVDLEIGCGNGFFFEHRTRTRQDRNLLGIEIKYKPLIQTVRRVYRAGLGNGRGMRVYAEDLAMYFVRDEIHTVFIYFPDPWPKRRHLKNRLLKKDFWNRLSQIQKPGEVVEFKTDSEEYFDFANSEIEGTSYERTRYTRDLHQSEWAPENFVTSFEKIFRTKGQPIFYSQFTNRKQKT